MINNEIPWKLEAQEALLAAVCEDWEKASDAVARIQSNHGEDVVPVVLIAWIDTATIGIGAPQGSAIEWMSDTGSLLSPDDVEPAERWAGWLINARLGRDVDQFVALLNSVPEDSDLWSRNCAAVLQSCAALIRTYAPARHNSQQNPN